MNYYVITKTKPGSVFFEISPINNSDQKKIIKLTEQMPSTRLPKEWALGVFLDSSVFKLYEKGYFSFGDKTDEIRKLAIEENVYFGNEAELMVPDNIGKSEEILAALKSGSRSKILDFITSDGQSVALIARDHIDDLPTAVVKLIEDKLKIQILVDEA